ncbi:MAG: hypothetical protein HYR62_08425 [Actinobacteria bacterium]|nr:hypothetical protein [Actinomycetota bacterium]MBI3686228.1 hypothetical protein [Actinomycetota bacterium]
MSRLDLPRGATAAIAEHIRCYGELGLETGALLMTAPGGLQVTAVALAGTAGITRRRDQFHLAMPVLDRLFTYAEEHQLQVRAHLHSHARTAFLSETDRRGCIRMRGFLAAVVPDFASPPGDPASWGWWAFTGSDWAPSPSATLIDGPVAVLTVDAGGVRAH